MKLFAQLTKVDEEKRLVFGRAAEEKVDKADEIMDYMSSKPHFQKWSAEIAKDTDGKNLGNVRAMHGKVAAGGLTGIDFNDQDKAIDVVAKIVDDNEWKKVLAGTYTGFSIGGSYVGEKKVEKIDGKSVTRYTARPTEISLVDRPCMPGAKFFEVQKLDGTLAKVEFHEPEPEDVTVNGTQDEVALLGKTMNEMGLSISDVIGRLKKEWPPEGDGEDEVDEGKKKKAKAGEHDEPDGDEDDGTCSEKMAKVERILDRIIVDIKPDTALDRALIDNVVTKLTKASRVIGVEPLLKVEQPLAKVDDPALRKLLDDAMAPLQKVVAEQAEKIAKLEAEPAAPTVSLRAVNKSDDAPIDSTKALSKIEPIVDGLGDKHDAAGIIKALHRSGGAPLNASMRK
jgi:hypothetical protein